MERYRNANMFMKEQFGEKVYKLAIDGGFTCPNRDGKLDTRGCIFCSGGSGDFAVRAEKDSDATINAARKIISSKSDAKKYIAYFQSFTGTYAPVQYLRRIYFPYLEREDIVAVSIGTRPDCISDDVLELLQEMNAIKPVWIELGLQTIHKETADYIRRCYELPVFDDTVSKLKKAGIYVIVHMIIGLPGETDEMILETARYIGNSGADGIKLQLLHVLSGTDLAKDYEAGKFETLSMQHYIELLEGCIRRIPPQMTVHRLTGDGTKSNLISPLWSADKKRVLNAINQAFSKDAVVQGTLFEKC